MTHGVNQVNGRFEKIIHLLSRSDLFNVSENVDNVPNSPRCFFNFACEANTAHGNRVKLIADERFGVEKALKQNATCCHRHLEK